MNRIGGVIKLRQRVKGYYFPLPKKSFVPEGLLETCFLGVLFFPRAIPYGIKNIHFNFISLTLITLGFMKVKKANLL